MAYRYFNANPFNRNIDDCVIRSISVLTNKSWNDVYDELTDLYTKRNAQKYSINSLGLTIAPTLACNFKCIYCYETSKPGVMNQVTMDTLIDFVRFEADNLTNLSVSWYGGEPLISKDIVYYLSEQLIDICEQKGVEYEAFMISNGSLIDDEVVKKLVKYRVRGIQITIDGP